METERSPQHREHDHPAEARESYTPRDAAKDLIRSYVARGDPIGWYLGRTLGYWCAEYGASIGMRMTRTGERQDLAGDQIAVTEVGGQPCEAVFPLVEIWDEVAAEISPGPRQRRLC